VSNPATNARIRREIYDLCHTYFQPGSNPELAIPAIEKLGATYGKDAVMQVVDEIKALDGQPIHRP
jgi:hypothetical protein